MSLLQELQHDALDPKVDIVTLLRKARVLGARLNNPEFVAWVQHELSGYPDGLEVPTYRILRVDAKAHLIIGAMQLPRAAVMASQIPEKFRNWATTSHLSSSVAELASLVGEVNQKTHEGLQCPWPQELAVKFGGAGYGTGRARVQCIAAWQEISVAAVVGVIETVRNRLLEFVLQIEAEAPAAGEAAPGQTPLPQERVTHIFHTHIYGGVANIGGTDASQISNAVRVGSMTNSQIEQGAEASSVTLSFALGSAERSDLEKLLREVSQRIRELKLEERSCKKAAAQIATIQAQLADDDPDPGIIAQAGATLRNVTEGAIGSLIASAVQPTVWHWVAQTMPALFSK